MNNDNTCSREMCSRTGCLTVGEDRYDRFHIFYMHLCDAHWEECDVANWYYDYPGPAGMFDGLSAQWHHDADRSTVDA